MQLVLQYTPNCAAWLVLVGLVLPALLLLLELLWQVTGQHSCLWQLLHLHIVQTDEP
jgi:hypothetical protein